ncbi:TPA: hypothetical protein DEP96_00960 [Candidatus Uhrbacteria bacterium]|nr:hypothetical protein [Candidatus Uhrbacteria bacterium]
MASLISVGQVVDQSIHHYRKYFKNLLNISLYLFAGTPFFIAATILYSTTDNTRLIISAVCTLIGTLVSAIASIWTFNALIFTVDAEVQNKKTKTEVLNRSAWKKFWPSLALSIIIALASIIVTVLCLLPAAAIFLVSTAMHANSLLPFLAGIIFLLFGIVIAICVVGWILVTTLFAPYALMLEDNKIIQSLHRARNLINGRWWATLLRLILPNLCIAIIVYLIPKIIHFFLSILAVGSPSIIMPLFIINDIANVALYALTVPFLVIANYYVFQSLVDTYKQNAS